MLSLKIYIFLYIKKFPETLVIICNLTHAQEGNSKVKDMLRTKEKNNILVGSETRSGSGSETICKVGSRSDENHSGFSTLVKVYIMEL